MEEIKEKRYNEEEQFDEIIRQEFRKVCYKLIIQGKKHMERAGTYDTDMDEEDITKQLFRSMDSLIDENVFPQWPLDVSLDPNIKTPSRLDENFPASKVERIDIYVKCVTRGPRSRFSVECKKLDSSEKWRFDYYCDGGIARFVEKIYAEDKNYAAMVGYIVSDDTITEIVSTITEKVARKKELNTKKNLKLEESINGSPTYTSKHRREDLAPIELRHLFLKFG